MSDLLIRTAELVDIASVSHHEKAIADVIERELRACAHLTVTRIEDNVVARTRLGRSERLVLAGHLDTVPPAGNARARIEGDSLYGCGSADMKGGLAILLELATKRTEPSCDVSFVFYACEEVSRKDSGLNVIAATDRELLGGDAAILLEPTGSVVEAGCQGVVRVVVTLLGVAAHSARPWTGRNAIHRLGTFLSHVDSYEERQPVIDGCTYRESLQAVHVEGGRAANVIPDGVQVTLSHRFAPDRNASAAFHVIETFLAPAIDQRGGDTIVLDDSAPAAPPSLGHHRLARLVRESGVAARAKLGWTDVAFFAERAIPAANFGPGDPELAHSAGEFVRRDELDSAYGAIERLLTCGS